MAAASVLAPSSHYQPPPSFAAATYPSRSSGPSPPPNMISSSKPRRLADDRSNYQNCNNASARQSLPSISEVISGARPSQYPPPASHSGMPPQPSSGGLPLPFAAPSCHPASFPSRQEGIPACADSRRPPFSSRSGLPLVTDRRPTPPSRPDGPLDGPVHHDRRSVCGGYPQPPAPTSHPYQPSHMPSGQMPLPGYPISPHHEHYDAPRRQTHGDPSTYARGRYDATPRHYENWTYYKSFSHIGSHSRNIFNFAKAYGCVAQEQGGLPDECEVNQMIANVDCVKRSLEQVSQVVHGRRHSSNIIDTSHRYQPGQMPPLEYRSSLPRPQTYESPYDRAEYSRYYKTWMYQRSIDLIGMWSRSICEFAERCCLAAQKQQQSDEPSSRELNAMIAKANYIENLLAKYEESHNVNLYNDGMKPHYPVSEVKKCRGRAAPPGRCYSCNRIDTPEWRRGPDGARTPHYAKLERKRQLEARSLRPKTEERNQRQGGRTGRHGYNRTHQ